jgi:hypothetical protein
MDTSILNYSSSVSGAKSPCEKSSQEKDSSKEDIKRIMDDISLAEENEYQ